MRNNPIILAAIGLALAPTAGLAQSTTQSAAPSKAQPTAISSQRGAVFIAKGDFDKVLGARVGGTGMGAVGAVRAGDDRINVDVLRRDKPDESAVAHKIVTEVYYILDGGGDFATGGALVNPQPMLTNGTPTNPASIGPSEKSATVTGGTSHHVAAGDVVMIPPGVVHCFTRLDGHVTYMVVRVNPGYEKGK